MLEPVVATFMTRSPVTVGADTPFKQVACALLASDAPAVPVVTDDCRLIGAITEVDLLANLEYHGGLDPPPLLGGTAARRRRRKASACTARELMSSPVPTIDVMAPISTAVRWLVTPAPVALCVVDDTQRLVGLLTRRDLLAVYRRPDADIAADVRAAIETDRRRPARDPADLAIHTENGVVTLAGKLLYRSQVEDAITAASRVAGTVAVRNSLSYDIDDMLVTGF
jgi:CBS domain-containing protein